MISDLPELPLELVANLDTLPILTTSSNVQSYNQIPIEESLIIRDEPSTKICYLLDKDRVADQPLHQIHQLISEKAKVPQDFVDKLVAFHLGHLSLSVDDITQYFLHLDSILYSFAQHCPDFTALSKNDQNALLLANAPLYYHLYLTR